MPASRAPAPGQSAATEGTCVTSGCAMPASATSCLAPYWPAIREVKTLFSTPTTTRGRMATAGGGSASSPAGSGPLAGPRPLLAGDQGGEDLGQPAHHGQGQDGDGGVRQRLVAGRLRLVGVALAVALARRRRPPGGRLEAGGRDA